MRVITPHADLIQKANKAITKYIWFPSNCRFVKRNLLKLPPNLGGIGFPDFTIRCKVNRLHLLIRILTHKEALSWRRGFQNLYSKVANVPARGLGRVLVPNVYREIRKAVTESDLRVRGDFCFFFGNKIATKAMTTKRMYDIWIAHKYKNLVSDSSRFRANKIGVDEAYVTKSWFWSKANYADGPVRSMHYKLRHKALKTNHIIATFLDVPNTCLFCEQEGNQVREDNVHVMIYCPRAYNLFYRMTPILERIYHHKQTSQQMPTCCSVNA